MSSEKEYSHCGGNDSPGPFQDTVNAGKAIAVF
jgi:hypothetical protein